MQSGGSKHRKFDELQVGSGPSVWLNATTLTTTLTEAANPTDTTLKVGSVEGFKEFDVIQIQDLFFPFLGGGAGELGGELGGELVGSYADAEL